MRSAVVMRRSRCCLLTASVLLLVGCADKVVVVNLTCDEPTTPSAVTDVTEPSSTSTTEPTSPTEPTVPAGSAFADAPTLTMTDDEGTPLVGELAVATSRPSTLRVEIDGPTRSWTVELGPSSTEHVHTLVGFGPDATHDVSVTVIDEQGEHVWPDALTAATPPLPEDFPELTVVVSEPLRMEPGLTLLTAENTVDEKDDYIIIIDEHGEILWYHAEDAHINEVSVLSSGHLAMLYNRDRIIEIDLWGRQQRAWTSELTVDAAGPGAVSVPVYAMHHDFIELPNGNFITFSVDFREVENYPVSEINRSRGTEAAMVVAEVLVEFTPDGELVHAHDIMAMLDEERIARSAVTGPWWSSYLDEDLKDWGHANALWYDADTDSFLASMRHQDAVVKFDRATGELQWVVAPDAHWPADLEPYLLRLPEEEVDAFHTHGMELTSDGGLLLFDNGNYRANAWERAQEEFSRVVIFDLDEASGTRSTRWSWEDLPAVFSDHGGDADYLPVTGNVLVATGHEAGRAVSEPSAHVLEVDPATNDVVFQLAVGPGFRGIYRARRIDRLAPVSP